MEEKRKEAMVKGEIKSFEQEYEAKFVSSSESFFDPEKVDKVTSVVNSKDVVKYHECVLGIDYGMVTSRTALAISYYCPTEKKIVTPYVKKFPSGKDLNDLIPFIRGLMERYNIVKLVVDDCPEGYAVNQKLLSSGFNVELFNFTRSKSETYCSYRIMLNQEKVSLLYDKELMMEMKGLQQEETVNGKLKIYKGGGLTDDLCDALIMSSKQWVNDEDTQMIGLELI